MRYCGREFTEEEIQWIRRLIEASPGINRTQVSVRFCEHVGWRKPDGALKDMSCRVALLRMERDGLLQLPARQAGHTPPYKRVQWSLLTEPQAELTGRAGDLDLHFELVTERTSVLWNEYIDRYHYLGYKPLPGAQLRYFIKSEEDILALLGFGAAAWKTAPRDEYIGWSAEQRKKNLHLVVNNARFLILPWVRVAHLASKLLAMAARALPAHWEGRYGYRPVLLETYVEAARFTGTCYRAANWTCVGQTQGRGKLGDHRLGQVPVKTVWVYPLAKDFRVRLAR